ncbi:MAG: radical SAM protein [Candidatus Omnitrophica bacterium]|nr:radical SAM protein [Candidatus Omnitrophota bacterium]
MDRKPMKKAQCSCFSATKKTEPSVGARQRDYILHDTTISLCPFCLERVDAKIIIRKGQVFLLKNCPRHGESTALLEEDADYYLNRHRYDKPATASKTQTQRQRGCPFDCGLCPDHDQHSCIGLIEVTHNCDLGCPVCYACSGQDKGFLDLGTIGKMLDLFQDSEFNNGEIIQISGGEPTTHPQILDIIALAKKKKVKYVMLNTNGLRIARDKKFVKQLKDFVGGFEIYLQFDGFDLESNLYLRGKDILAVKQEAIRNLARESIPITLVASIAKGVNDHEIGRLIDFGLNTDYIRGINFQPLSFFGRIIEPSPSDRITLTGVLKRIEEQTDKKLLKSDFIPLPCNVDRVAIGYLYKRQGKFVPLMREVDFSRHLSRIDNTFAFAPGSLAARALDSFFQGQLCECLDFVRDLSPMVPADFLVRSKRSKIEHISKNTFRISVSSFLDAYNFEIKAIKKECVHMITPDCKKIPFSTYNILYRKNR